MDATDQIKKSIVDRDLVIQVENKLHQKNKQEVKDLIKQRENLLLSLQTMATATPDQCQEIFKKECKSIIGVPGDESNIGFLGKQIKKLNAARLSLQKEIERLDLQGEKGGSSEDYIHLTELTKQLAVIDKQITLANTQKGEWERVFNTDATVSPTTVSNWNSLHNEIVDLKKEIRRLSQLPQQLTLLNKNMTKLKAALDKDSLSIKERERLKEK